MNFIATCFNDLLHLFYPEVCAGCGSDLLRRGQPLCLDCIRRLPLTNFSAHAQNPVERIFHGRLPVVSATAYTFFSKNSVMQQLLHDLKYRGNRKIGHYFGRRMGVHLLQHPPAEPIDALVPLPMFASKEKKRGFNQADTICEGMAAVTGFPLIKNAVIRKDNAATQTRKNRKERWENIQGGFRLVSADRVANKHLLLVDDVVTTGATLEACGRELMRAPNTRLSIAALAYTSLL